MLIRISVREVPFRKQLKGHNSATFERIRTEFDTEIENEVPELVSPAILISPKIQYGGSRHKKIYIFGHNWAIIAQFAQDTIQMQRMGLAAILKLNLVNET